MKNLKTIALITIISIVLVACATVPISGRKQITLVPEMELMRMSLTQYKTFLKENPPMASQIEQTKQVKRVGNRIAHAVEKYLKQEGQSKRVKDYKWEFNLINKNVVNAWAMPGGKVVVYKGLLPVAKTDEGLAVVMGHEIAHAIARHGNERMSQGILAAAGGVAIAVYMKDKPKETQALFLGAYGVGAGVGMLAFGRNQESEADKLGMVFMSMAGYQPKEAIPFWERMKGDGGASIPEFLSTHPSHDTRIRRIQDWLPTAESYFEKAN